MNCTLQVRSAPLALRPATSWFIPGNQPARWLEELSRAGWATDSARLLPIARNSDDPSPAGVLVALGHAAIGTSLPSGFACGVVGKSLYLPVEAQLFPELTPDEGDRVCAGGLLFLHPTLGATWFSDSDFLHVWDLLELPQERSESWNGARTGISVAPPLKRISLAAPATLRDLFAEESRSIGDSPLEDLPSTDDESDPGKGNIGKKIKDLLSQRLADAARKMPPGGSEKPILGKLMKWAANRNESQQEEIQRERFKELIRLRDLLTQDPERGLRHAIPMNNFAHRGIAKPSSRLGEHGTDFNLNQLGGGAADFWDVPPELQQQLRQIYREMANREARLGRHRRAAFIYAHLLGDLSSAAATLKEGRHFREASVIYSQQLKSPLAAADCLAEGGLLREASELYRKAGRLHQAAELLEKLEDRAGAEELWTELVKRYRDKSDWVAAARILEGKLHRPDDALAELASGWPSSSQATLCLTEQIHLLSRLGRENEVLRLMDHLRNFHDYPSLEQEYLATLTGHARTHPDQRVRRTCSDLCRMVAGRQLAAPGIRPAGAQRILENLVHLFPEDPLITRDTNRYLQSLQEKEVARAKTLSASQPKRVPGEGRAPTLLRTQRLPGEATWSQILSEGHQFFALGKRTLKDGGHNLHLLRGNWSGAMMVQENRYPLEVVIDHWYLEPTHSGGTEILLANSLDSFSFAPSDAFGGLGCTIHSLPALHGPSSMISYSTHGYWHLEGSSGAVILRHHHRDHGLVKTWDLSPWIGPQLSSFDHPRFTLLSAWDQGAAIAQGKRLLLVGVTREPVCIDLPENAVRLAVTPAHTRAGIAVCMEAGVLVQWCPTSSTGSLPEPILLASDLTNPFACFVPGGPLVLVSGKQGMVLEADSRGIQTAAHFLLTSTNTVGLLPAGEPGQFGVLTAGGDLQIFAAQGPSRS